MNYEQKYLKYKEKYFSLKKINIGGTTNMIKDVDLFLEPKRINFTEIFKNSKIIS